ncbi:MAG: hypothetical protein ACFFDN_20675 [Candidatus Hodarchaeota archaeon]
MSRYDGYSYNRGKRGSNVFWIFVGILAFCAIYFPFFGANLRYQVGNSVGNVLTQVGGYIILFGFILIIIGIVQLIGKSGLKSFRTMIFGVALLAIGTWFINPGSFATISHGTSSKAMLSKILLAFGTIMIMFGLFLCGFGLVQLWCGRSSSAIKKMILGFVIMYLGGFFLGLAFNMPAFGSTGDGGTGGVPEGYH